jgi:hypothetical protein
MCWEPNWENPKRVYCYLLMPSENFVIYAEIFYFSGKLIKEFMKTDNLRSNAFLVGGVKDLICLTTMFSGSKEISKSYKNHIRLKMLPINISTHPPFSFFIRTLLRVKNFFLLSFLHFPRDTIGPISNIFRICLLHH